jgi:hypothetical protein
MHVLRRALIRLVLVGFWIALMPPLFTHGACTAEFDAFGAQIERDRIRIATLDAAEVYLASRKIPYERNDNRAL